MMIRTRSTVRGLGAVLAATFLACAPQTPPVDLEAEAQAVRDVSAQWMEYVTARDVDGTATLIADDAVFFSEDEEPAVGLEAIRASTERWFAEYPDATVSWSPTSVEVAASGDLAWEWGRWSWDPDGAGEAPEFHGAYITVYRKIDGAWKAVTDMGVRTEPMAAPEEEPSIE